MRIPKGFIKDSEGIYRRGNFVFRDNKIFRESAIVPKGTIEEVADNYTTVSECIRAILAFPASIGEKPRTTDIYVNKVGNNFKQSDKFTKDTVAIVTSDRNVIDIKAKDISDSTEFKDLISKDKPVKAKEIKSFSSDKPKDSQEVIRTGLKESESSIVRVDVYTDASDENGIIQELRTNSNPIPQEIGIKVLNEHGPAGGNPEILLIGDLNVIKNWLHTELFDDDMYVVIKESYSEKLGGDPEDFISDVNDILAHVKTFDTNKLATKLAYEIIEDFEMKCEDLISMAKGKYLNIIYRNKSFNESAEGVDEFWDKFDKGEVKIGDKFENGPELLKANKKADYILVFKNDEYVAAWAPELSGGDLVWGQGHYFDNEKDANEYFSSKLNESEKLNEEFYDWNYNSISKEPDEEKEYQEVKKELEKKRYYNKSIKDFKKGYIDAEGLKEDLIYKSEGFIHNNRKYINRYVDELTGSAEK